MEDKSIIELYFARNEQAINETSAKYGKLCYSIAHNILNNNEDTEECVNDTYLALWNTIPPAHPENLLPYIYKIVRNISFDKLDFSLREKRSKNNIVVSLSELEYVLSDDGMRTDISTEELGHLISKFLKSQKEDTRNVFIRKYFFFDSISDISKRYSFTESKVKNMLYHTRKKLKDYLQREGIRL